MSRGHQERQRRSLEVGGTQKREYSAQPVMAEKPLQPNERYSREGYKGLVNTYASPSDLWEQPSHIPSKLATAIEPPREHIPLAPRLVITPAEEEKPPHAPRVVIPAEERKQQRQIAYLHKVLDYPPGRFLHFIWSIYQRLRPPRPRYLSDNTIRSLFRHLAWVEFRDLESCQRYFTFLNECAGEGVPILPQEWNTAISFAARWTRNATSEEVKTAIETWMRMEKSGAEATNVTFNILFDAAARAGRFALADTIFNEIKVRELPLDRNFRTSMIYYAGLRRDGDAVRQAFRDLVNAGEIVDTAVMNCVIVSLVRAGEAASAENVFSKMKDLHETKFGALGPKNWRERKQLNVALNREALRLRQDREQHESSFFGGSFSTDDQRERAQRAAPIHPDAQTCRILLKYHASRSGNLVRCRELIAEMKKGGQSVHGSVYMYLLKGFCVHGGHAYTAWNRKALEEFWEEFLRASSSTEFERAVEAAKAAEDAETVRDHWGPEISQEDSDLAFDADAKDESEEWEPVLSNEDTPPFFTAPLAKRAIEAFYKCAGRKRMLQVWAQIQERWEGMSGDDRIHVEEHVQRLVRDDSRHDL